MRKLKLAVAYGSICGGCDVAFVDVGEKLIDLTEAADIVHWPSLMDGKEGDLERAGDIDVGIYFGGVRTDKHKEVLELLREKSGVFVAFGACACHGGVPGLANVFKSRPLLERGYVTTKGVENPEGVIPGLKGTNPEGGKVSVPRLRSFLSPASDFVDVDIFVPGCPPPVESVSELIEVVKSHQKGHSPPRGLAIAEETSLCDFCDRQKSEEINIERFRRVHEAAVDKDKCFLEQGIICMGPVTRGGCGAKCINANMPCRGCFGPVPGVEDQGTKFLTTIAAALEAGKEREVGEEELKKLIRELRDPVGLFYMFSLAASVINRRNSDLGGQKVG